ncbi:MAG: hypothetical protein ACXW1C_05395 [Gallionella sp.]
MPNLITLTKFSHSSVLDGLNAGELQTLSGLFERVRYKNGECLSATSSPALLDTPCNLSILTQGKIEVKIPYGLGESTVCILIPGDLTNVSPLDMDCTTKLYAQGDIEVLNLHKNLFSILMRSEPQLMCRLIQGMLFSMQSILQRINFQVAALQSYIYSNHTR